jgi:hypothetical protein
VVYDRAGRAACPQGLLTAMEGRFLIILAYPQREMVIISYQY